MALHLAPGAAAGLVHPAPAIHAECRGPRQRVGGSQAAGSHWLLVLQVLLPQGGRRHGGRGKAKAGGTAKGVIPAADHAAKAVQQVAALVQSCPATTPGTDTVCRCSAACVAAARALKATTG